MNAMRKQGTKNRRQGTQRREMLNEAWVRQRSAGSFACATVEGLQQSCPAEAEGTETECHKPCEGRKAARLARELVEVRRNSAEGTAQFSSGEGSTATPRPVPS